MLVSGFAGCCTAKIIQGFGGTILADHGWGHTYTVEELTRLLLDECENLELCGNGIAVATTNSDQPIANAALEQAGFQYSRWCRKTQHQETKVRLWFKPLLEEEVCAD